MFQMKKYWEDPAILHINRELARSTYIPYGDADASKNADLLPKFNRLSTKKMNL
jgi:hypothetical protein